MRYYHVSKRAWRYFLALAHRGGGDVKKPAIGIIRAPGPPAVDIARVLLAGGIDAGSPLRVKWHALTASEVAGVAQSCEAHLGLARRN